MFWGKIKEISKIVHEIPPKNIVVPENRVRHVRQDSSVAQLAESIAEHGVLEPILVRRPVGADQPYTLVAGERRLRAARLAGLETVPVVAVEVGEIDAAVIAIIENLHRQDLTMFEEANAIHSLISITGMTQENCAKKLSVSQSYVANKLRLLKLSDSQKNLIVENALTERHARALLRLPTENDRDDALEKIIKREMNVGKTEEYIEELLCAASRATEKEEKKEQKRKLVVRDLRLFYNSIDQAVEIIKRSGIPVEASRKEVERGVLIEILLTKNRDIA